MSRAALRQWARGVAGAAINSGATAVTVLIVDPVGFSPATAGGWGKLLSAIAVSAVVGAALYLKQHPLPPEQP